MPLGEDGDDAVGLPQLDRAQDDTLVPVQVHYTSVIRLRHRASSRCACACDGNFEMFERSVGVDGAEAAVAALELGDRVEEVVAAEVGPAARR